MASVLRYRSQNVNGRSIVSVTGSCGSGAAVSTMITAVAAAASVPVSSVVMFA